MNIRHLCTCIYFRFRGKNERKEYKASKGELSDKRELIPGRRLADDRPANGHRCHRAAIKK